MEKDDLSLLAGMKEGEGAQSAAKASSPSRNSPTRSARAGGPNGCATNRRSPGHSLKALAIREKKIHIVGRARNYKIDGTPVYLDVGGPARPRFLLPHRCFGCVARDRQTFHSFWADQKSDEPAMFARFAEAICELPDFRVLHFGEYEAVASEDE